MQNFFLVSISLTWWSEFSFHTLSEVHKAKQSLCSHTVCDIPYDNVYITYQQSNHAVKEFQRRQIVDHEFSLIIFRENKRRRLCKVIHIQMNKTRKPLIMIVLPRISNYHHIIAQAKKVTHSKSSLSFLSLITKSRNFNGTQKCRKMIRSALLRLESPFCISEYLHTTNESKLMLLVKFIILLAPYHRYHRRQTTLLYHRRHQVSSSLVASWARSASKLFLKTVS